MAKCPGCGVPTEKKVLCRNCQLESRRRLYIKNKLQEAPQLYLICSNPCCGNAFAKSRGGFCARCGHRGVEL